ncbi:ankyrin repeat-containing domain protein [Aspergillus leporis]|uniref:Ankyrin repeat-containing domain protein n=1 Tax=Aspergillus leporis TaxID=41062 RepID=A0A5N5WKU3_9EURO|nr:ankyrin repeat-containing domain protein [Aspergillus leporis]
MAFTHDDYAAAWVCALPLEMAAAKVMLNEVHPSLAQPKTDHNVYTLGAINGNNVVIACLPAGNYGTIPAATVLSHMLLTFPCLRFCLMVGIGGGVPSNSADIRLGDVVISMPTATYGGVIQYDYGKTLRDGRLQRIGTLNKPPQILLTAASQIRSNSLIHGTHFGGIISDTLQKYHTMRQVFSRPSKDWLFDSSYSHLDSNHDCSTCDQTYLINRVPRATEEPYVHYGLIASGNQVMKDAKTRDAIAQEMNILCFEMEAAGLMDQLPCLVIRGICDYCDSHKHKQWQGYAALSAATYTRVLLSTIPVTEYEQRRSRKAGFTADEKACLQSLFLTDPTEDKNALKRRKGDRAPGTCTWILDTDELRHWLGLYKQDDSKESNIFWLYGNPGTGKSTMAITLSEELPKQPCFARNNRTLLYFFCDSTSENQRTATAILRGLLFQLIKQRPHLIRHLHAKYEDRKEKLFVSFDALWAVMMDIVQDPAIPETYCIIDALDECEPESQQIILRQMSQTFHSSQSRESIPNMHILITSRPYPEVDQHLYTFRSKDLATYQAVARDLKYMIQEKVDSLRVQKKYTNTVASNISQILEDKAEGTFLWVGIACGELAEVQSRNAVKTLQGLPRGLHSLYQQLLKSVIANIDKNDWQTVMEMLSFTAVSQRTLTLTELSEACQLYLNDDANSRLQFTRDLIDLCRLIIVVQDGHVRLLHKSVKDFLINESKMINILKSHATLADRCIKTIIHKCQLGVDNRAQGNEQGFLGYSILHWPDHAGLSQTEFRVKQQYKDDFFRIQAKAWEVWLHSYNYSKRNSWERCLANGFSPFHAAAQWGIPNLFSLLPGYIDAKDERGQTPLLVAVQNSQLEAVRCLISAGAQVNALNNMQQNSLHVICQKPWYHDNELIELLLAHGSSMYICDADNMTPFLYAIAKETKEIALILIQKGFDINFRIHRESWTGQMRDKEILYEMNDEHRQPNEREFVTGLTALHFSALNAAYKMTAFLLQHGADPNVRSDNGDTPLHLAIRRRLLEHLYHDPWISGEYAVESYRGYITDHWSEEASDIYEDIEKARICGVVTLLAKETVDVNLANSHGDYPIHVIPFGEAYAPTILSKLLERGANASSLNQQRQTCLHLASRAGNLDIVRKLREEGHDIAALDNEGLSPLDYAVRFNHPNIVRFLFACHGKQLAKASLSPSQFSRNYLHYHLVSELCSIEMIDTLLQYGYKVDDLDSSGNSALGLYLGSYHLGIQVDIFLFLVERGADPLWVNHDQQNLAHLLMRHWGANTKILEYLMQCGLDLNAMDSEGKTIIHHGAIHGAFSEDLVQFLQINSVIDLHIKDSSGETPLDYAEEKASHSWSDDNLVDNRWRKSWEILKNTNHLETTEMYAPEPQISKA